MMFLDEQNCLTNKKFQFTQNVIIIMKNRNHTSVHFVCLKCFSWIIYIYVESVKCCMCTDYLCHKLPCICSTFRWCPHSWLITGFITRVPRRVHIVEQELLTIVEALISSPVFSGVRVARSFVFCVVYRWPLFVLLSFFIGPLSIYVVCLPLWYLQTVFYIT
jgi:hypothetical protein